jgi:predicted transglutaminase-like cysteine proteinase
MLHNRLRAGVCSSRYGRNMAGWLFALLAMGGSSSTGFPSSTELHPMLVRDRAPVYTEQPLAFVAPAISPVPLENASEPFGLEAIPAAPADLQAKWRNVERDIRADVKVLAHCRQRSEDCPPAAQRFLAIVDEGRAHDGRARIGLINRAVNLAIRPVSDLAQWGVPDHWSSPLETFSTGRGDCEDYAIAKYIALLEAGVAEQDVKLIIERDLASNQDHAVVATRLDGNWIVLDNRWFALVRDVESRRVIPLFALDNEGIQRFTQNTDDRNIGVLKNYPEIAPAGLPKLFDRENQKVPAKSPSRNSSAFLDLLTNSVNSGNLLLERRLTMTDMREYVLRTYGSHLADASGG